MCITMLTDKNRVWQVWAKMICFTLCPFGCLGSVVVSLVSFVSSFYLSADIKKGVFTYIFK